LTKFSSDSGASGSKRVANSGGWNAVQIAYASGRIHRIASSQAATVSSQRQTPRGS
jgi:hypothetical protein